VPGLRLTPSLDMGHNITSRWTQTFGTGFKMDWQRATVAMGNKGLLVEQHHTQATTSRVRAALEQWEEAIILLVQAITMEIIQEVTHMQLKVQLHHHLNHLPTTRMGCPVSPPSTPTTWPAMAGARLDQEPRCHTDQHLTKRNHTPRPQASLWWTASNKYTYILWSSSSTVFRNVIEAG